MAGILDLTVDVVTNQAWTDCLAALLPHGVPTGTWTVQMLHAIPSSKKMFTEKTKNVWGIRDVADRGAVLALGVRNEFFPENAVLTPAVFYNFCVWLRSAPGREAVTTMQRKAKLTRKTPAGGNVTHTALASCLQQQIADYSEEVRECRLDYDVAIRNLQRQIDQLHLAREKEILDIKAEYRPASDWREPEEHELMRLCWEEYVNDCAEKGRVPHEKDEAYLGMCVKTYGDKVKSRLQRDFAAVAVNTTLIRDYLVDKIARLERNGDPRTAQRFVFSWSKVVSRYLKKKELSMRRMLMLKIPIGKPMLPHQPLSCRLLPEEGLGEEVGERPVEGVRRGPPLAKVVEWNGLNLGDLLASSRLTILVRPNLAQGSAIPHARSKFEAGVRKVIGGGEMRDWETDSGKYRGGGHFHDAVKLLAGASSVPPGRVLSQCFSVRTARECLQLPNGLRVPDGPECCRMNHFNDDATAGPFLRAFDVKKKYGLKKILEDFAWMCYDDFAGGIPAEGCLPFVTGRIGYRTKLMPLEEAAKKISQEKALGRCVMMLDAFEQAFSSPLYNELSKYTAANRFERASPFRNAVVRASTDWIEFWKEVRLSQVIIELDWKKFDRERPREDILFMIEVILSCFEARSERERSLLRAYGLMLRRALVERILITDDGGIIAIDGMVPSGSLWTGWLDTALNALYINGVLRYLGILPTEASPKCAGDDNLTLFSRDPGDGVLLRVRDLLNDWFRAGIEEEEFLIHRPPFYVTKVQARFPPDLNLSWGTSRILDRAVWVEFQGECPVGVEPGWSHRWKYVFEGRPKFLGCYWLENGSPIRPAHINSEKLLFPEGIHKRLDDYEAAVISMVVDNPFNQHNVNHMMHRFCIIQQVKRLRPLELDPVEILWFAKIRGDGDEEVPFPMVGSWRRSRGYVKMEELEHVGRYMRDFDAFKEGVSLLYSRAAVGGLDAWRFLDILRGESGLGSGQYGNDMEGWLSYLEHNPLSKYLRPIRQFRRGEAEVVAEQAVVDRVRHAFTALRGVFFSDVTRNPEAFARWVTSFYHAQRQRARPR
ncbi:TPA_asm: fusion protein [Papaver bracteatum amalgavirus 1]|nr:TPA_asm: fusion protein [Papaver bracteatum amalgavirus 1]